MNKEINKNDELTIARVIEVHREMYKVKYENMEKSAKLKSSVFYKDLNAIYPAVGDYVKVNINPQGDDIIHEVMERKSKFSRFDSHYGKEQLVATNFDHVFILTSLNHDFNIKRLERYLASAWESGGMPSIIFTKRDLIEDYSEYLLQVEEMAVGVPLYFISSVTGEGIEELKSTIKPNETIVFLGSSGVGKSSLVNALCGYNKMRVNEIREDDSKGKHTTTHRQLITLDNGAMIIDTPGMRELAMYTIDDGLDNTFSDIVDLFDKCRFSDCKHMKEPGCAVKAALAKSTLSLDRWENYLKLEREAKYARKKEKLRQMRMDRISQSKK